MKKRHLFLGCFAMLFISIISSCSSDTISEESSDLELSLQRSDNLDEVCENLENSFMINARSVNEKLIYPKNYGGAFIENEELIILIKGEITSDVKTEYFSRAKSSSIKLRTCEYSYNELKSLRDNIRTFFSDKKNYNFIEKIEWSTLSVDEKENRVLIKMNCTPSNLSDFKSVVSSSPMILFENSKGFPQGCSLDII